MTSVRTGHPVSPSTTVRRIIVGPTAAGKSALAMHLARARGLAIVSADSRQVYQGFDTGTAHLRSFGNSSRIASDTGSRLR